MTAVATTAVQGMLVMWLVWALVIWRLTGRDPLQQVSRGMDLVRATCFLVGVLWVEGRWVVEHNWEQCVARAERER